MPDEIVIFVVRDGLGNVQDLGELVDAPTNKWALRSHDSKSYLIFEALRDRLGEPTDAASAIGSLHAKLRQIADNTDQLEAFTDGVEALLTDIRGYVDSLETVFGAAGDAASATGSVHAKLRQIADNTDQLEAFSDGVEALLTDIRGYVDSLETVFGAAGDAASATGSVHAKLRQIADNTDQLEAFSDGVEALLQGLIDKDFATQATLALISDALRKPRDSVRGSATIAAGSFVTVVSKTPSVAVVVTGVGGDIAALTNISYRFQLVVDGTVKHEETLAQNNNSWVPIEVSVAANAVIEVKLRHGEIADQSASATIAWREL